LVSDRFGGRTRTRTLDPLIKSQLLYQLSYAPGLPWRKARAKRASVSKGRPRWQAAQVPVRRWQARTNKEKPPG
jgi:hypothetical protein